MTPSLAQPSNFFYRAPSAVQLRGFSFGDQYWYWFSAGVPAAGS